MVERSLFLHLTYFTYLGSVLIFNQTYFVRTIYFSFYHVLIFLGIFQGLLLSYIFLFNKKFRKKSSIAIAISMVTIVLSGASEILQDLHLVEQYSALAYLPISNLSLSTLGLYYFVVFLLNPNYRFQKIDFWILLPFGILFILKLVVYSIHLLVPQLIENRAFFNSCYNILTNFLPIVYLLSLVLMIIQKVNHYHENLFNNFSETRGKELYWLRNLAYLLLGFSFFWCFVMVQVFTTNQRIPLFYALWVTLCFLMIWLAYFVILRRDVFAIPIFNTTKVTEEKGPLSDKTEEHYQRLLQLMEEEKLYRDAQLSMDTLAEKTQLSNGYLSKIINQKEGKNFYNFVNAFRIAEVKTYLTLPDYDHYSILGIGLEAGFKSKSTFNAVFKKMTGMTPSAYKKTIK